MCYYVRLEAYFPVNNVKKIPEAAVKGYLSLACEEFTSEMRLAANRPITVESFVHLSLDLLGVCVNFVVTHCKQLRKGN